MGVLALVVAIMMVLGSVAALADGETTPTLGTNNLTQNSPLKVTNLEQGDTVYYYKVIEWVDNSGWAFTTQFADLGDTTKNPLNSILTTSETVDSRIDTVLKYITGVPADYTVNADADPTPATGKEAIAGKINSKLAGIIASYAKTPIVTAGETVDSSEIWQASLANTSDAGLYLVLVAAGKSGYVYNPIFVASNYYNGVQGGKPEQDTKNQWDLLENSNTYSDSAMAKKETITVDKKVTDINDEWVDGEITGLDTVEIGGKKYSYDEASTSKIGDVVKFTINTTIPVYAGNYTADEKKLMFTVYDIMSTGLTLEPATGEGAAMGAVTVKGAVADATKTDIAPTNYSVSTVAAGNDTNKNVVVTFTSDYVKSLTAPMNIEITYTAKVTDTALYNVNTEKNTVQVEYSNNPNDVNGVGILKDVTNHYTFSIDASAFGRTGYEHSELVKVGVDKDGNEITEKKNLSNGEYVGALQGAKFTLYTDESCAAGKEVGTAYTNVESDANGKIKMNGLDVGTYYLKETSAPAGYIPSTTVYKIEISATFKQREVSETVNTTLTSGKTTNETITYTSKVLDTYTVKVSEVGRDNSTTTSTYTMKYENETATENIYTPSGIKLENASVKQDTDTHKDASDNTHKILNTQGVQLPSTGGVGTTIFYVAGSLMVLAAAILLITKRRMGAED